jgi:hypothetical protein
MRPTQKEPRLPSPLGRPHMLFDGSFINEFLQPGPELDASVLMRATYVGGHELAERGKDHPQVGELFDFYLFFIFFFFGRTLAGSWDGLLRN